MKKISPNERTALGKLWKEAFGDGDEFLDLFFRVAYDPRRCCGIWQDKEALAALYWLDCQLEGRKIAYIYAVATAREYRGRGLCRELMAKTHQKLQIEGYAGSILVPGKPELREMYEKMGYRSFGGMKEFSCEAGTEEVALRQVESAEFVALRRRMLPAGGVIQEGENLAFLGAQAEFFAGEELLLAVIREGNRLFCPELLGNATQAPGILKVLGCREGTFRVRGEEPFAMYRPIDNGAAPAYFAFAFD